MDSIQYCRFPRLAEGLRALAKQCYETDDLLIDDEADVDVITDDEGNPTGEAWVLARVWVDLGLNKNGSEE